MTEAVEIFSATDPPILPSRVVYYTEFRGVRSEELEDHGRVFAYAMELCAKHGACYVDRSDGGSGLLLATLRRPA